MIMDKQRKSLQDGGSFLSSMAYRVPLFGARLKLARERVAQRISERDQVADNLVRAVSQRQGFIHSIPKSGVTWCLLLIANYWARSSGRTEPVDFDVLNSDYILHSIDKNARNYKFHKWLLHRKTFIDNAHSIETLIHSHKPVPDLSFKKSLLLFRNPYDFVLSYHKYLVTARGDSAPLEKRIKVYLDEYASLIRFQSKLSQERCSDALILPYETLKMRTSETLVSILRHFGVTCISDELVADAIRASSVRQVKKFEAEGGQMVARGLEGGFIRSGVPGQWREELTSRQMKMIEHLIPADVWIYVKQHIVI